MNDSQAADAFQTPFQYDDSDSSSAPCDMDNENLRGAQLSYLYYFLFAFSLLGNGLVLLIIYRFDKLTTVINIFLLNLVVSDLILMGSLPFWGVYQWQSDWTFGEVMCKIVGSTYSLGIYSSVLFLTLMTFDRYLAVVYSLAASRLRSRRYAVMSCAAVWLISGLACIKPLILFTTHTDYTGKTICSEDPHDPTFVDGELLHSAGKYIQLVLFFLFPLIVITYCYIRITITVILSKIVSRFKTVRLIFVIVLLFFVCWTPYNVVLMMYDDAKECDEIKRMVYALHVTQNTAYLYFFISPIFYTFVGKKFQNHFRQLLVRRFPFLKEHVAISRTKTTTVSPS